MRQIARALVRLYPRAWRARYEDELLALVEETGLSWPEAFDLCRGAIVEQARSTATGVWTTLSISRQERLASPEAARLSGARSFKLPCAVTVMVVGIAFAGKLIIRPAPEPLLDDAVWSSLAVYLAALVRLFAIRPTRRAEWDADFMQRLNRFPLPRINRAVARLSYRVFGVGAPLRSEWPEVGPVEGVIWLCALTAASILFAWLLLVSAMAWRSAWIVFYLSKLVVDMASAMAQTSRARSVARAA